MINIMKSICILYLHTFIIFYINFYNNYYITNEIEMYNINLFFSITISLILLIDFVFIPCSAFSRFTSASSIKALTLIQTYDIILCQLYNYFFPINKN